MEDLIAKMLKIEDRAQEIVASAKLERENLQKDLEHDADVLSNEIKSKKEAKISYLTDFEKKETEKRLAEISEKTELQKRELEKKYNAEKDAWVERIFAGIVK